MKVQGGLGGAFISVSYAADTISFHENDPSADTIEDSAGGLLTAGLMPGMSLIIAGSGSNDKTVTLATVTATAATLIASDDLADEGAGSTITLTSASSGAQVLGCNNWTGDDGIATEDSSCYEDFPYETHETGFHNWSATLDSFWLTDATKTSLIGQRLNWMLFIRTSASPSAGDPAVYYSGYGIVQRMPRDVPAKTLTRQSIEIIGDGQLTLTVKTDAWA